MEGACVSGRRARHFTSTTYDVSPGVGEGVLARLGAVPLLSVLRDQGAELGGVVRDSHVGGIGRRASLVDGGAEVHQAGPHGERVELGRREAGAQQEGEEDLGVHGCL